MPLTVDESRLLESASRELGVRWDSWKAEKLGIYRDEILSWSDRVKLVSQGDLGRLVEAHFVDSMRPLPYLPSGGEVRLLDLGSGAGFPGLVLKIFRPELEVLLLESNRKKRMFLAHMIRLLRLPDIQAVAARSEEIVSEPAHAGRYRVVVARALGSLSELLRQAVPFTTLDGLIVTFKPAEAGQEMEDARRLAGSLGLRPPVVAPEAGLARRGSLVLIERASGG